ncbi:MAG: hypothetical protein ACREIC_25860, partial [Limisphaerales bacterium]
MNGIPESDWKVFRKLHGVLMERFFEHVLEEVTRAATNPKKAPSERFVDAERIMRQSGKDAYDLGDHRRSTAFLVIARMCNREKLLLPEEFE